MKDFFTSENGDLVVVAICMFAAGFLCGMQLFG